jgi:hypothetical protein
MAKRKDRMALLSRYNKLYLQKYEAKSVINFNAEQWVADALLDSYGLGTCYDLLEYYFSTAQNPTWNYFSYHAQQILNSKITIEQDLKERQERRELGKRWLSE